MTIQFGDAGTNRAIAAVTFGDAGTNRVIKAIYFGDAGTNRLVFSNTLNLQGLDPFRAVAAPGPATAAYSLTSAGLETASPSQSGTWLPAGSASSYDVRLTLTSGSVSGSATATWLNLGTTRTWNCVASGAANTVTAAGTIEIRDTSTLVVLASASVGWTASTV